MDLLDLPQLSCIKCQNSLNLLTISEQEHHELICERCLELQTKKYIYLNLEIQYYQRKIKQINENSTKHEKTYNKSLDQLQQIHEQQSMSSVEYNEMNGELNNVQQQIKQQSEQSQKLQLQLIEIEQQQRKSLKKYHLDFIRLAKLEESIAERQQFIRNLQRKQKQLKEVTQLSDFNLKY